MGGALARGDGVVVAREAGADDLEMVDAQIKFGKGKPFSPELKQVFREGSRTRVIDLPGDDRVIKWIEFSYRNLPGGGRARVQAWAK